MKDGTVISDGEIQKMTIETHSALQMYIKMQGGTWRQTDEGYEKINE